MKQSGCGSDPICVEHRGRLIRFFGTDLKGPQIEIGRHYGIDPDIIKPPRQGVVRPVLDLAQIVAVIAPGCRFHCALCGPLLLRGKHNY